MTNKRNLFDRMGLHVESVAETENPKTVDYTVLRNRLLPSLMEVLSTNRHHPYPQNLFEVATSSYWMRGRRRGRGQPGA